MPFALLIIHTFLSSHAKNKDQSSNAKPKDQSSNAKTKIISSYAKTIYQSSTLTVREQSCTTKITKTQFLPIPKCSASMRWWFNYRPEKLRSSIWKHIGRLKSITWVRISAKNLRSLPSQKPNYWLWLMSTLVVFKTWVWNITTVLG